LYGEFERPDSVSGGKNLFDVGLKDFLFDLYTSRCQIYSPGGNLFIGFSTGYQDCIKFLLYFYKYFRINDVVQFKFNSGLFD